MQDKWISLQAALVNGGKHTLNNQDIWLVPMKEFKMEYAIKAPITLDVVVSEHEDGLLLQGNLKGILESPCGRCAKQSEIVLDSHFDSFEAFPDEDEKDDPLLDSDSFVLQFSKQRGIEVNLEALAWEEFMEVLPELILCDDNCKGLCPICGVDRNTVKCDCENVNNDPRMEKLRGLKIVK